MATLCGMVRPTTSKVGFLLPLFREFSGSNSLLSQRIDLSGDVAGFDEYILSQIDQHVASDDFETAIGEPAIWCFGLPNGKTLIGDAETISSVGIPVLKDDDLKNYPMAASDLAAFCGVEHKFPKIMLAAFNAAEELSERTAALWRDAVVLLPHIQEDLRDQLGNADDTELRLRSIICVSRRGVTHIFAPAELLHAVEPNFSRWRAVANVFNIQRFELHPVRAFTKRTEAVPFSWRLVGAGGVGRWAVRNAPFKGTLRSSPISSDKYAISEAPMLPGEQSDRSLIIAVVGSDYDNIKVAERASVIRGSWPTTKHAMMVRPMGFGTPRPNKVSVRQLPSALPTFDYFWIVGNHRRRKPLNGKQNMATSRAAARFVKDGALALIDLHASKKGSLTFNEMMLRGKFGLIGAAKHHPNIDEHEGRPEELIRRAIASALTEDAYLHTAEHIIAFWPEQDRAMPGRVTLKLGRHRYEIEVRPSWLMGTGKDVVLLALNVKPSRRTASDFQDFVVSLFSEFFWVERHRTLENVLFEDEGEAIRIWPVATADDLRRLVQTKPEQSPDLIITNQSIPWQISRYAQDNGWDLIHYSDLYQWMQIHHTDIAVDADENNAPSRSGDIWV